MTFEIPDINLKRPLREERTSNASVSASVSSELNIRTQEGDLVNLSYSNERSVQESNTQSKLQDSRLLQEISTIAQAASGYSITVQGDLNEEELAAINKLAADIAPIASGFFTNAVFDFENSSNILADNLDVIQEVQLSLERTIVTAFSTQTVNELSEEGLSSENVQAALTNPASALKTEGIRDFPALVNATMDAVFEAEAAEAPKANTILRSLNDLLEFLRQRLVEFFGPEDIEIPPEVLAQKNVKANTTGPSTSEASQ
tara:strand:- start:722 stop:1501 length:780 start_codon:yes stop_codon:yes gene_type:complete